MLIWWFENEGYEEYITYIHIILFVNILLTLPSSNFCKFFMSKTFFNKRKIRTELIIFPIFNEINATLRNEHRCKYQESNLIVEFTSKYLVFVRLWVKLLNEYLFQESFEILVQVSKANYCNNLLYWLARL